MHTLYANAQTLCIHVYMQQPPIGDRSERILYEFAAGNVKTKNKNLVKCIKELKKNNFILRNPKFIRIEEI